MLRHGPGVPDAPPVQSLPELAGFDTVYIPLNPYATNVERAVRIGERVLQGLSSQVQTQTVVTKPGGYDTNSVIFDAFRPGMQDERSLIMSEMGDGGLQVLIRWMLERGSRATVLPLPGGNACDLSTVMLGGRDITTVTANLSRLQRQPFYPLVCTITDAGGTVAQRVGHSNWGAAISGRVAHMLNRETVRRHPLAMAHHAGKFALETAITLFAASTSRPYDMVIDPHRGPQPLRELLVSNLPVMAKVGRFAVNPHEPEAFVTAIGTGTNNPLSTAYVSRQLTNGHMYGIVQRTEHRRLADGSMVTLPVISFVTPTRILAQMDGEPFYIPAGSTVQIEHAQHGIRVLSLAA